MTSASLNVSNFVTLRLKSENYSLWREQVLALAESQELVSYLTGESSAPATTLPVADGSTDAPQPNPEFRRWKTADRLLRGWIIGTLSEESLGIVIGLETSAQVWNALKEAYVQASQERKFQLTQQLTYMKKDPDVSLNDYLRKFKGARYEPFTSSMLKPPMPSYGEVVPLLQSYETRINLHSPEPTSYTAFYGQKGNKGTQKSGNFSSKGKGFSPANQATLKPNVQDTNMASTNYSRGDSSTLSCQICKRPRHSALRCWYRFDHSIQPDNLPKAFAALTNLDSEVNDDEWTSDTGASAHMTSHKGFSVV